MIARPCRARRRPFPARAWPRAVAILLLASGCASAPVAPERERGPDIVSASEVLLLRPIVRYERVHDEAEVKITEEARRAIEQKMLGAARDTAMKGGFAEVALPEGPDAGSADALVAFEARLARGIPNEAALAALRQIGQTRPGAAVLAHSLEATVGPSGSYNPMSGAITSGMSRLSFHAALLSCSDGKVLWSHYVLLRDLPGAENPEFAEALSMLYEGFPRKGRGTR